MHYEVNIWCVRESSDLFSEGMSVPDKKWNVAYKQYSCTVTQTLVCGSALLFIIACWNFKEDDGYLSITFNCTY